MHIYQKILSHLTVLNLLLAALILFTVFVLILPSLDSDSEPTPDSITATGKEVTAQILPDDTTPSPVSDYALIAEQNLFHAERKMVEGEGSEETLEDSDYDFILYGTLVTDQLRLAYLENTLTPVTSPGRGKRQVALKVGETFNGFTLQEVHTDNVVLVRGDEEVVILISDPGKPKERTLPSKLASARSQAQKKTKKKAAPALITKKASSADKSAKKTSTVPFTKANPKTPTRDKNTSYKPEVDYKNNRTPGGFLFNRMNR